MADEIKKKRRGVFLVVVDGTQEFTTAVDYASEFANAEEGYVALLNVIEHTPVSGWQGIEARVRKETRAQAEQMIWTAAGRVLESTQNIPMVSIEEGDRSDRIIKTVEGNKNIVALVLASASGSSNPGPLVTYFSGKGLSRLPVPLMIVPGHLIGADQA
tara:strand:- start:6718 stop:7194 length:477 start_codon:yes stop_codon:yes gene_type:complete